VKKVVQRLCLCSVMAIALCVLAFTAASARERPHTGTARRSADQHAKSDRGKKTEENIPISLQRSGSSGHAGPPQKIFKIVPSGHPHVHAARRSVGSDMVGRNAIGLPIVRHEVVQPQGAVPLDHLQTRPFGLPSIGTGSLTTRNLATIQHTVRPVSPPLPTMNRGAIGGVALIPHRTVGLGGQSAPIGMINGTAFLPKR
jgi:hypothetical protein